MESDIARVIQVQSKSIKPRSLRIHVLDLTHHHVPPVLHERNLNDISGESLMEKGFMQLNFSLQTIVLMMHARVIMKMMNCD